MLTYDILVKENEHGVIKKVFVPDFCQTYKKSEIQPLSLKYVIRNIEGLIINLDKEQSVIPLPSKIKQSLNIVQNDNQYWTTINVQAKMNHGNFEKILPAFGGFVTIGSALCASVSVILSVLLLGNGQDTTNSILLALTAAFFSLTMQLIDYFFSTSSDFYSNLGKNIDDLCKTKKLTRENKDELTDNLKFKLASILGYILIAVILGGDVIFAGTISPYQASKALCEKAIANGYKFFDGYFKIIYPILVAVFNGAAGLSFHVGFANLAGQKLNHKIRSSFFDDPQRTQNLEPDFILNNESQQLITDASNRSNFEL